MKNKSSLKARFTDSLNLPKDAVLDIPTITIIGNDEINIENHKGIVEYSRELLRINSKLGIVKVVGENLFIKEISQEELLLTGKIHSIEFIN